MARGLARGWRRPLLCADPLGRPRRGAGRRARRRGVASNAELARRADLVVLCHKPAQLASVAAEVAPHARAVASILGGVALDELTRRLPRPAGLPVPAQHAGRAAPGRRRPRGRRPQDPRAGRRGARAVRRARHAGRGRRRARRRRHGTHELRPRLRRAARRGPGRRRRPPRPHARQGRRDGRADVRRHGRPAARRGHDTLAVRREVTSPGGSTARGLAALERAGVRAAFDDALDAVLGVPA